MLEFSRDPQQTIPTAQVKIVGLGGAGANMLDRLALEGADGAEMLALNTDVRTLSASAVRERIQLGRNLTRGLGCGGDPDLGQQATQEAENEIRAALRERRIVFLCVGLGGGTGSGGAPVVARMAREEGAFVVVFASIPFSFEGRRRREQAERSLNELSVLANALVTFDNARMSELVLAKQGIHEAFAAADRMIAESIKAITRIVTRPGLIHVGLDDLVSALRTTRSRCLFGSGSATGKDRAAKALRAALASPLLDQGLLLRESDCVLVHLCGGEDLTLFEVESLMQRLGKHVPPAAHVLFGAAIDPAMGESLSVTMISSLPEDRLREIVGTAGAATADGPAALMIEPSEGFGLPPDEEIETLAEFPALESEPAVEPQLPAKTSPPAATGATDLPFAEGLPDLPEEDLESSAESPLKSSPAMPAPFLAELAEDDPEPEEVASFTEEPYDFPSPLAVTDDDEESEHTVSSFEPASVPVGSDDSPFRTTPHPRRVKPLEDVFIEPDLDLSAQVLKSRGKKGELQAELAFEGGPRGKFTGEVPNVFEGENLDVPAYLRRKKG